MNSVTIDKASVPVVTYGNLRVITTECLSGYFGAPAVRLRQNYQRNADRFVEGKHFFKVTGSALREFVSIQEIPSKFSKARALMLWTARGVARHAKMLDTDSAWELFEKLEDAYFSQKAETPTTTLPLVLAHDAKSLAGQRLLVCIAEDGSGYSAKAVPSDAYIMNGIQFFKALNAGDVYLGKVETFMLMDTVDHLNRSIRFRLVDMQRAH